MCAHHSPFISAGTVSPNRHGECGSPSWSENLWCLRWSATQRTSGPSTAIEPITASTIRSGRFALKEPCVKYRWKPMVMPWQARKYMNTIRPRSSQLTPQPQTSGIAASSARKGTTMNSSSAICSTDRLLSPPRVAEGAGESESEVAEASSISSGLVVMRVPWGVRNRQAPWAPAPATDA